MLISGVSVGAMASFNVTWPLSFTYVIYDLPLEAHCQKKKTRFLSFIPSSSSLPSEVKGTLWRSCLCYFILFFLSSSFIQLSFAALSPSFIASSPRPANDRDFTGCQRLVIIRPLALFVWPRECQTGAQMPWLSKVLWENVPNLCIAPPARGWFLTFSVAMITRCQICVGPPSTQQLRGLKKHLSINLPSFSFSFLSPPPLFFF